MVEIGFSCCTNHRQPQIRFVVELSTTSMTRPVRAFPATVATAWRAVAPALLLLLLVEPTTTTLPPRQSSNTVAPPQPLHENPSSSLYNKIGSYFPLTPPHCPMNQRDGTCSYLTYDFWFRFCAFLGNWFYLFRSHPIYKKIAKMVKNYLYYLNEGKVPKKKINCALTSIRI